jgi:hypothetical protein
MTSAVGGSHLPESHSGPCRWLCYHELNTHKVTKRRSRSGKSVGVKDASSKLARDRVGKSVWSKG